MISFMKIIFVLLFGVTLLFTVVHYSSSNPGYTNNVEGIFDRQISRHGRAVHYCRLNYFYDEEKGRCLSVPGAGRILHVEKGRSCGNNIMRSHCSSPLYYHICTRDRSILAQCGNGQIFDSLFQRCIRSRQAPQLNYQTSVPNCTRVGRFSIPGHCSVFYTCHMSGRQLYQSVYKCPRNTGYYADKGICAAMSGCDNDHSVDFAVCVPNKFPSDENFWNPDEVTEKGIEKTTETSKEHTSDPTLKAIEEPEPEDKSEEKRNLNPDVTVVTPDSVTDNSQSVDNKKDNGMDNTSMKPIEDNLVSKNTKLLYVPTNKTDESLILPEDTISSSQSPDESNPTVESPFHTVNDEQQKNVTSYEVTSGTSTDSSQLYTTDPSFASQTNDASQLNSTTEENAYDSSSPINENQVYDTTPFSEISETTQLSTEDVPNNADETSTVKLLDPTETTTQEALEKDQSPMWITSPSMTELNDDASDSIHISTTEYSTNADMDSNVDTTTTDTSLLISVSDTSPELNEETYATTTAQYENDDTSSAIPSSFSAETVDQDSTSNDTSTTISDPSSDDSGSGDMSVPDDPIFSLEPVTDSEEHTTENALIFETSVSPENEPADINLYQPSATTTQDSITQNDEDTTQNTTEASLASSVD